MKKNLLFILLFACGISFAQVGDQDAPVQAFSELNLDGNNPNLGSQFFETNPKVRPSIETGANNSRMAATSYTSRPAFEADACDLVTEDFEGSNFPNNIVACDNLPISNAGNCLYPAGEILAGFSFHSAPVGQMVVVGPFFGNTSTMVGPNFFADNGFIDFDPPVGSVGFDLPSTGFLGQTTVTILGPSGVIASEVFTPGFVGFVADEEITRLEFSNTSGTGGELIDDLSFGPTCGGGGTEHCVPSDCLLVACPDDVTVACIEDYVADAANATAVFNCTGDGGNDIVETFNYTGGVQTYTVPAGVNVVTINAYGAQGGANAVGLAGASGGDASGSLIVTPGDVLEIYVGGMGTLAGGFNGGANGGATGCANSRGGGGGGASDVRIGGSTLANRIIVAAGGGGAGGQRNVGCGPGSGAGAGGGYYGGGGGGGYNGGPGQGGTQNAGGTGGIGNFGGGPGGVGTLGMGGAGGSAPSNNQGGTNAGPAGGDGGGLNGGAGGIGSPGWRGGGGGGGSSYVDGVLNGETNAGTNSGDGRIEISYDDGSGGGGVGTEAFRYVDPPHATGAANCPGTVYEIVYHVGDNLGNVGCCVQLVTIENAPPVVTVPPGETVTCYEDIPIVSGAVTNEDGTGDTGDATVTTSCNGTFFLKILPPVVEGVHQCPGTTYSYGYRVRDICGREVITNRIYTIGNNAPPTIVAPPDMTIACAWNAEINPDYATVTTGCTLGYTTTVTGPTTTGSDNCPGATYTYTYTVTDDCGRTASDTRKFTVANTAPVFLNCPSVPLQLNCEDEGWEQVIQAWLASIQAESSCSAALNVTNNYNPNSQGLCINNGTKIVRFFATDACGRTSTCEGMVIVADTEPPLFVTAPQNELVVCNYITQDKLDAWVDAHGYAEVEDCWANVNWSTFPNNPTINCGGNPGPTSLVVTFVATDGCGNKASMDATFTALPAMGGIGGSTEDIAAESMQLFQNQPNPFNNETSITFYLPEGGKATLSIYDVSGKLLKEINGEYSQGMNVESISRSDLQGAGMLYYQLSTATESATQRMILLD